MKKCIRIIKDFLNKLYIFISSEDPVASTSRVKNLPSQKREIVILISILVVLLLSFTVMMDETDGRGWEQDHTGRYYIDGSGNRLIGWHEFDGLKYYFNASGIMETGLIKIDGSYYYFGDDGTMRSHGFHTIDSKQYYFGIDGRAVTGWYDLDGLRYHFSETGAMDSGLTEIEGSYYYFGDDGIMRTCGLHMVGKKQYYFGVDGRAVTGWTDVDGQGYRFFNEKGVMQTGWRIVDDQKISYFGDDGLVRTGFCEFEGEGIRYFDSIGIMQTGLVTIHSNTYMFDEDGLMLTGYHIIDDTHYYFDKYGKMAEHDQVLDGIVTENGVMYYYENGEKTYAGLIKINSDYYYVNSHYEVVTGEYHISTTNNLLPEGTYEFDKDGKLIPAEYIPDGIVLENGRMYYYEDGLKTYAGLINIYEDYYYVNANFEIVTGEYYITKTNGLLLPGSYKFDSNGKLIFEKPVKNGLVQESSGLYYYENGILSSPGLIYDQDAEAFYYIRSNCKAAIGEYPIIESRANRLLPAGTYTFDTNGKMIIENIIRDGLVMEADGLYYYENGLLTHAGLIYDENKNGYRYINSSGKVVTGPYLVFDTRTNGLLPSGRYDFGKDGLLIVTDDMFECTDARVYREQPLQNHFLPLNDEKQSTLYHILLERTATTE